MDRQNSSISARTDVAALDFVMPLPLQNPITDIFLLTSGRTDLAVAFLEGLFNGELLLQLPTDFKTTRWAFENHVETQNRTRLYGGHWFWFGFPLIEIGDAENKLLAPLWLWPINLRQPGDQDSGWTLQLAEQITPQPNPQLDRLFREKLGWEGAEDWWHSVGDSPLDMLLLSQLVSKLTERITLESSSQSVSITPWSSANLDSIAENSARLIWSGFFGQYPPGFPAAGGEVPVRQELPSTLLQRHPFGLLRRDPWQETAFQEAVRSKGLLIRGSAGSGKTALLQDMLLNALSNGERCLVISDRLEILRDLQDDLIKLGLDKMMVFLHQANEETALVHQLLKGAAREKKKMTFASNQFAQQLQALLLQKATLDQAYHAANKRILGPFSWTQTVGLYLSASRLESKALLGSQLNAQDFDLGFEKYQALFEQLSHSQALFEEVKTLSHPLTVLNAGIFVHQEKEEARVFILSRIKDFSEQGADLQYRYILAQNDYGDRLVDSYEQFYRRILDLSAGLQERILSYKNQFGQDPLESTRTTLKLYASFSEKFKKTLGAKEDIANSYDQLEKALKGQSFIQHDFLPEGERHLLAKLRVNLEKLQQQLHQWREQMGHVVQEELIRLSSKTAHPDLPGYQLIGELENQLDLLVEGLNDSGLLQLPLENKNLTLPRRQRFLEEIIEKLDRLRYNMRDFDHFFDWERYWFSLPAESRRIITALVKVKPNHWPAAFSSWYLHHQLLQQAELHLPESLTGLGKFTQAIQDWKRQLIDQIIDIWMDRRATVLQKLKKDQKVIYDQLTAKKDQNKNLSQDAFSGILSHFFPLILASPFTSYDLLTPDDRFDWLLVDEAHLINPALLEVWKTKAKKTVLFDNPEFGSQELPRWVRRQAWQEFSLEGSYLPGADIQLQEVAGRYNSRQGINDEEARKLLVVLNTIEENPQRTLPKVAIVGLTRAQRNLIFQYLDRIKRQRLAGVEKIQQLERNGLGIYAPDELHGLHADILIISGTYGRTGATDQLTTDIQQLNDQYAPGLVTLLRSRARQAMIILHSIPEEDLRRIARDRAFSNVTDLARWILSLQDPDTKSAKDAGPDPYIHPLAGEIAWHIANQVRTDRLAFQVPFGPTLLPMTVAPLNGEKTRAILMNGFLAETPATNYEWEWEQQAALQEAGYQLHPVWSVGWWRRLGAEAAGLTTIVNTPPEEEE